MGTGGYRSLPVSAGLENQAPKRWNGPAGQGELALWHGQPKGTYEVKGHWDCWEILPQSSSLIYTQKEYQFLSFK